MDLFLRFFIISIGIMKCCCYTLGYGRKFITNYMHDNDGILDSNIVLNMAYSINYTTL